MENKPKRIAIFRKEHFNAAHRLDNPEWTAEENQRIFGKCNNPNYHGHNYELYVQIIGEINPKSGYVIDMKIVSEIVKECILDKFDHKNLNLDLAEFRNLNPTAENIAVVIYDILRKEIAPIYELKIKLYETERNFVEYPI